MRRRAAIAALLAVALGACGPPSTDDDPLGSAGKRWDRIRTYVDQLESASGDRRTDPRNVVCNALGEDLRRALERRAGGRGQPDCQFLERIPLLNGSTRLGALEGAKEIKGPGPQRVTARVKAVREGRERSVPVEVTHSNPGNWEITALGDLP